jgi:hypothetical protein
MLYSISISINIIRSVKTHVGILKIEYQRKTNEKTRENRTELDSGYQ